MKDHVIVAVHVNNRKEKAAAVQEVLTWAGCCIKTRLGLHETTGCSESKEAANGLIILEIIEDNQCAADVVDKLNALEGVEARKIVFAH